jgi:hypothetical protein
MGELIIFIILVVIALIVFLDAAFSNGDNNELLDNIKNLERYETSRSNTNGKGKAISKR